MTLTASNVGTRIAQPVWWRLPLLGLALVTMLAAVQGGLLRLGWAGPASAAVPYHGPLMISGFLGTLISLERAVALGRAWSYAAPAGCLAGGLALLLGLSPVMAQLLFVVGSAVLALAFVPVLQRQRETFVWVMLIGAVAWLVGNVLWLAGGSVPEAVPWWVAFLVLTIVGERLELSRFLGRTRGQHVSFLVVTGIYILGLVWTWIDAGGALVWLGLGQVALALWLGRFDLARRTVRQQGLTRFVALALLAGYGWLALGGALSLVHALTPWNGTPITGLAQPLPPAGPAYDAVLHATLLGFVFSMIFGHAPIIFPSVLGVRMQFGRHFYLHLLLLHATLAIRLIGDLTGLVAWRQWGGLGNAVAIAVFLLVTAGSVRFYRRHNQRSSQEQASPTARLNVLSNPVVSGRPSRREHTS